MMVTDLRNRLHSQGSGSVTLSQGDLPGRGVGWSPAQGSVRNHSCPAPSPRFARHPGRVRKER